MNFQTIGAEMSDVPIIVFGGSLILYTLWFTISLERLKSSYKKNKSDFHSMRRRMYIQVTVFSLMLPIICFVLALTISFFLTGQELPMRDQIFSIIVVCPSGLWLTSMLALWSYTWRWHT